jgi:VWFA-related protein
MIPLMNRFRLIPFLLLSSCLVSAQTPTPKPTPTPSTIQQPPPTESAQDVIKITTNLVQIDAVVTKGGKQVTDLTADDFEIFQDGKAQTITNFSYVSNIVMTSLPPTSKEAAAEKTSVPPASVNVDPNESRRTIAFVVDDLGMSNESTIRARKALKKFVNEQLAENDLAAIIKTSGEIGALQQFTTDRRMLLSAVEHLTWQPCSRLGAAAFDSSARPCSDNMGSTLRALKYFVGAMASLPGRKAMVLFSDNVPLERQENGSSPESDPRPAPAGVRAEPVVVPTVTTGGTADSGEGKVTDIRSGYKQQFQSIADLAIRSSVVIYTIDSRGLPVTFPTAADRLTGSARDMTNQIGQMMSDRSAAIFSGSEGGSLMAKETGGFAVTNNNGFDLKRVYQDQQGYYLIGFRPSDETFDQKFHHTSVRVKKSGFTVRSRAGFYGFTNDEARAALEKTATSMNEALRSPFGANQITVRLNSLYANTDAGPLMRVSIYVNANDISFSNAADNFHDGSFDVKSALFGDNGQVIYQRDQTATLHLNQSQYERTLREGVVYGFDVPVKYKGAGQVRVAVRDHASQKLGSTGQLVTMPDLHKNVLAMSGILLATEASVQANANLNLALRRFRQGERVMFAYAIYKAQFHDGQPQLTAQTRVFREGKLIFTGQPLPVSMDGQFDRQRITAGSRLQLGSEFPPGNYVLQVIVTDKLAKQNPNEASQWIDFEVVK